MPVFIAFYTLDTPYEEEIENLRDDCDRLGLRIITRGYPSTGSWVRNAGIKPQFISEMLEQTNEDLVYIDADARIRKDPILFKSFKGQLGVHYRRGNELLSGTIYLKNSPDVKLLVKLWAKHQAENPDTWDQKTLQAIIKETGFPVTKIPASYTQIFDTMKHHGDPIIEHMQASRRYRRTLNMKRSDIPNTIGKVRIREGGDGTLYITRRDKKAEAYLDKHATRIKNQLRWYPVLGELNKIGALGELFRGRKCYIVGKGPSLDYLHAKHFTETDSPVIALNEAIHRVEGLSVGNPLFGLQMDATLRGGCLPKRGRLLVSIKAANFYAGEQNIYIFDSRHYKLSLNSLSVSAAIAIAKSLGATHFELLCFDASVNSNLEYAECVGYDSSWGGHKKRFLTHRAKIEARVGGLPLIFTIPKDPASPSVGKSQQSRCSQREHHAP